MDSFAGRVFIEGDELVANGYDSYLTKQEQREIVNNIISTYRKHNIAENFNGYLKGLAFAVEDALNAKVISKSENLKSWNQFPRKTAYFTGQNPMKTGKFRNIHQVFPVAARKTRRNRRSSRKSRR